MSVIRRTASLCAFKQMSSKRLLSTDRQCKEIRIPGPWGSIAGKWWGPQDKRPILGIHGWQDNSGTFDRLAPFLPPHVGFLAIDMPGHGLSSQLPPGVFYHGIDIAILIRRITEYFNWPKVSLLGHSMGAISSFTYTMMYPEILDFLICIDCLQPFAPLDNVLPLCHPKNGNPQNMAKTTDDFIKYDLLNSSKSEPPSYTFTEMEQLLHKGSNQSIGVEATKYILRRSIAPSTTNPEKFYFTRDPRLKVASLLHWSEEDIFEGSKRITCPLFLCLGKSSPFVVLEQTFLKILDIVKENGSKVEYHRVEGTHHLHLNNPENVEGLINAFIEKYDVEDRSVSNHSKSMQTLS